MQLVSINRLYARWLIHSFLHTGFPDCIPGLTSLNNIVNSTTPDGAFYETGYPSVCIRGRYAPICSDVSLTSRDVSELCLRNLENPFEYFGNIDTNNTESDNPVFPQVDLLVQQME